MQHQPATQAPPATTGTPKSKMSVPPPHLGVYLLLLAMTTSDALRPTSLALTAHADGLGDGYSTMFTSNAPSMLHLADRLQISEQFSSRACEGESDATEAAPRRRRGGCPSSDESEERSEHTSEYDAATPAEDFSMEIEDPADEVTSAGSFATNPSESTGPSSTPSPFASKVAARIPTTSRLASVGVDLLARSLEFLSLTDINAARGCGGKLAQAASWIAPQPFTGERVTFVRCGGLAELPDPEPRPHAPPVAFYWRCFNCSAYSTYHEACTHCGANVRHAGVRIFIGQLRKRHSALALRHMLAVVCPEVNILHIESHSNRDGYEKGAAWLYVDTPQEAMTVLSLNKRVFFDADAEGFEGFWFVEEDRDDLRNQLFEFSVARKTDDKRRRMCLPGQPLVAEFPKCSMLSGVVPTPLHNDVTVATASFDDAASASTNAVVPQRDANGWYRVKHTPYSL